MTRPSICGPLAASLAKCSRATGCPSSTEDRWVVSLDSLNPCSPRWEHLQMSPGQPLPRIRTGTKYHSSISMESHGTAYCPEHRLQRSTLSQGRCASRPHED